MTTSQRWATPHAVEDVDIAFPARGPELTPSREELPEDMDGLRCWRDLSFALNIGTIDATTVRLLPKEGIDAEEAWRHLLVAFRTFGTKIEDKLDGTAYLMSLWFDAAIWPNMFGPGGYSGAGDEHLADELRRLERTR